MEYFAVYGCTLSGLRGVSLALRRLPAAPRVTGSPTRDGRSGVGLRVITWQRSIPGRFRGEPDMTNEFMSTRPI
jgi:hypothetical protein